MHLYILDSPFIKVVLQGSPRLKFPCTVHGTNNYDVLILIVKIYIIMILEPILGITQYAKDLRFKAAL